MLPEDWKACILTVLHENLTTTFKNTVFMQMSSCADNELSKQPLNEKQNTNTNSSDLCSQ